MTASNQQFGKYRILDELGKGGFATVYRANDSTLDREVALKILLPQMMNDSLFVRGFQQEARTLAALQHPAIIMIYEIGEAEGRLFIAMELAHGPNLAGLIADQDRLHWPDGLAVLRPIFDALDYAHGRQVIHRDLKPSNILVDERRGTLLSDFGFARLMGQNSVSLSRSGGILGTPGYIAPEVWDNDAATVQSDIYSLGCVVYEAFTSRVLFDGPTPIQIMRAHDRGPQFPVEWPQGVPAEVAAVLLKALAHDPAERYQRAGAFWHALHELEAGTQRAREAAELAVQVMATAAEWRAETEEAIVEHNWRVARMAVGRWLAATPDDPAAQQARATIERLSAVPQPATPAPEPGQPPEPAANLRSRLHEATSPDPATPTPTAVRPAVPAAKKQDALLDAILAQPQPSPTSATKVEPSFPDKKQAEPASTRPASNIPSAQAPTNRTLSGIEKPALPRRNLLKVGAIIVALVVSVVLLIIVVLPKDTSLRTFTGHTLPVNSVAFSPDGLFALSGSDDNSLRLWDVATSQKLRWFTGHTGLVESIAFSPDGKFALSGSTDKTVRLWDVATGQELRQFTGHTDWVKSVAFSPDGKTALSGSDDNTLRLWDVATGQQLRQFTSHIDKVRSVAFSPDGKLALSGGQDTTLRLWDVATGQQLRILAVHTGSVESVAFSPDGKLALSGSFDKTLRLWDVATGQALRTFTGHTDVVRSVAFSPDGETALSGSDDKTLRLWDVATGRESYTFTGHKDAVRSVAFSPDGITMVSASVDRTLRLWDMHEVILDRIRNIRAVRSDVLPDHREVKNREAVVLARKSVVFCS